MLNDLIKNKISQGLLYRQYIANTITQAATATTEELEGSDKEKYEIIKLNLTRMARIDKSYLVSEELKSLLELITEKQTWMIITENWCGDSAQNIPYIAAMAAENKNIDLKLVLRDSNADVMDLYLTNSTKSIPILVAFDKEWNELFRWGSRPKEAQELVFRLKSEGMEKQEYLKKLHLWYAINRGKDIEAEITELLKKYV